MPISSLVYMARPLFFCLLVVGNTINKTEVVIWPCETTFLLILVPLVFCNVSRYIRPLQ